MEILPETLKSLPEPCVRRARDYEKSSRVRQLGDRWSSAFRFNRKTTQLFQGGREVEFRALKRGEEILPRVIFRGLFCHHPRRQWIPIWNLVRATLQEYEEVVDDMTEQVLEPLQDSANPAARSALSGAWRPCVSPVGTPACAGGAR